MSETSSTIAEISEEALRIVDAANEEDISLRLLGGLAIYFQCPSARSHQLLQRSYNDLDFMTLSRFSAKTRALFTTLGYSANKTFNALHGHQRLLFWDEQHERQVDIFIDRMQMCHNLDLRSRLQLNQRTVSISDLVLTKLQIVEINAKDILDIIALFHDFDVGSSEQGISIDYITGLTANDWGWYKTLEVNLHKTRAFALEHQFPSYVIERIHVLLAAMNARTKSLGWKARAVIGERVRWYELPEEAHR
jgi:hypothetical protein